MIRFLLRICAVNIALACLLVALPNVALSQATAQKQKSDDTSEKDADNKDAEQKSDAEESDEAPNKKQSDKEEGAEQKGAEEKDAEEDGEEEPDSPWIKDIPGDHLRQMQLNAIENEGAYWAHWGAKQDQYSSWKSHSNRLIPIYTFGMDLDKVRGKDSTWRSEARLKRLFGSVPKDSLNEDAEYFDQSDVYRLQKQALAAGKKNIILFVFDGMDWETTRAASVYNTGRVTYLGGRGHGLHFQDYRGTDTDFGYFVTSPDNTGTKFDVNAQTIVSPGEKRGGYNSKIGGETPWSRPLNHNYLLGKQRRLPHVVTDSAASATSMTCGVKTYNGAIGLDHEGNQLVSIAQQVQFDRDFSIGVVTSVPISHATPAAAYSNNVTRNDYQDLTRDLLGLRSVSHRDDPAPGVDVLMGGGWGEVREPKEDPEEEAKAKKELLEKQGENYVAGNKYLTDADLHAIDVENGGKYRIAQRTKGRPGKEVLDVATLKAVKEKTRLFGFFGVGGGHLPFQTADGKYNPTRGANKAERYTEADVHENVTLADMTNSALRVLETNENGFWLMIEAGDVDWANHDNNIDNSIGAVLSGDDAFRAVTTWVEKNEAWDDTVVILTADHGHYLVLRDPSALLRRLSN